MLEIINRRHEEIFANRRTHALAYINFVNSKNILFSVKAVRSFGIYEGMFAHFVNDGDRWFVYFNDDADGFPIVARKNKTNLYICSMHLIKLFAKRAGRKFPCKCILKLTGAKSKGRELIELDLNTIF